MSLLTLRTSQSWMPCMDTEMLSWTPSPTCSLPSTLHMVDITSYASPFA